MKTVYQDEKNVVLYENSVERKSCINRESKSFELTIQLYRCHNINMKFLVVVTPPSIYKISTQCKNNYVEPSWRREEITPKYQRDNFSPARQCPRCVQFIRRFQLAQKELNLRCRRDNFAPTGFEILGARQIIPRHEETSFFRTAHFFSQPKKWKKRLEYQY